MYLDFAATTTCQEWETPIGNLPVDEKIVDSLVALDPEMFRQIDKKYEENEHSLEMHLPYVRKVFEGKDIKIVPLMIGQIKDYPSLAKHLVTYFMDDRTLFVISSDFCHWGSRFDFQHKYENY